MQLFSIVFVFLSLLNFTVTSVRKIMLYRHKKNRKGVLDIFMFFHYDEDKNKHGRKQ